MFPSTSNEWFWCLLPCFFVLTTFYILKALGCRYSPVDSNENQDEEEEDDLELMELDGRSNDGGATKSLRSYIVKASICETWLPPVPGAKPLTMFAQDGCSICLGDFKEEEVCWVLDDCDHAFHKPCIKKWLKMNRSCPICRSIIAFSIIVV